MNRSTSRLYGLAIAILALPVLLGLNQFDADAADTVSSDPEASPSDSLEQSQVDLIRGQVERCWNVRFVVLDGFVRINISLNPDGSLRGPPSVADQSLMKNDVYRAAAESAQRAILLCSPFVGLSASKYDSWREVEMTFSSPETLARDFSSADDMSDLRRAAWNGDSEAQYRLGVSFETGDEVSQDYVEAEKWYRLAAAQGHADAQYDLGNLYYFGDGVLQDHGEAAKWIRLVAEQGEPRAEDFLGWMYEQGEGVDQSFEKAAKWYRKAIEQGHPAAYSSLAVLHVRGDGVPQDILEAARLNRMGAELGDAYAQAALGQHYELGEGVRQDYVKAETLYRLAAEQGNDSGQFLLGHMYEGGSGVPQDLREAFKWYELALAQGHVDAQYHLGLMYSEGRGVRQDKVEAHKWFNVAAAQGNEDALKDRDTIASGMTPSEIEEAYRRAYATGLLGYFCYHPNEDTWYEASANKGCIHRDLEVMKGQFDLKTLEVARD